MKRSYPSGASKRKIKETREKIAKSLPKVTSFFGPTSLKEQVPPPTAVVVETAPGTETATPGESESDIPTQQYG